MSGKFSGSAEVGEPIWRKVSVEWTLFRQPMYYFPTGAGSMAFKRNAFLMPIVTVLVLLATASARAQTDQTIYSDNLTNGWADWSWSARDLASSDFTHSGTKSIKVTYTTAYQGFYLHHDAFSSSPYSALSFWISGGGVAARKINVQALINDSAQAAVPLDSYITGGGVAANEWREVTIPISSLQAGLKTNM